MFFFLHFAKFCMGNEVTENKTDGACRTPIKVEMCLY